MNGNHHAAAQGGYAGSLAALISLGRSATQWMRRSALCRVAHRLALTVVLAGAGQAQAQDMRDDSWARISPNAGYGFGFNMESLLIPHAVSARPDKYDLLYRDAGQGRQRAASPLKAVDRSTAEPNSNPKAEMPSGRVGGEAMATLAPGFNGAVPLTVFTGAISTRCTARYAVCDRDRFTYEPASNLQSH